MRHARSNVSLGRHYRLLTEVVAPLVDGLKEVTSWHRWLYDAEREGRHQPQLDDFFVALQFLVTAQEVIGEITRAELKLANTYASWADIGAAMHVTRQAAHKMAQPKARNRTSALDVSEVCMVLLFESMSIIQLAKTRAGVRLSKEVYEHVPGWAWGYPGTARIAERLVQAGHLEFDTVRNEYRPRFTSSLAALEEIRDKQAQKRAARAFKAQARRAAERAAKQSPSSP